MTSVDFFAIKERIVAILKADTTNLWWTNDNPSTKTKFRKIEIGQPTPKAMNEPPLPRCWVTSDDNVATVKTFGSVQSNTPFGDQYDLIIKIMFVVEAKDGPKTEEDLDDFTKSIIDQLHTNYDLRTPGGAESTQLAHSTDVINIANIRSLTGDTVQGRIIRFKVVSIV